MSKLLSALINFRDSQARKEGVEDFKVLQYKTIEEITRAWPRTFAELSEIKGIGPAKLKKYGEVILQIIEENTDGYVPEKNKESLANEGITKSHSRVSVDEKEGSLVLDGEKQVVGVGEYIDYLNLVFQKTADVQVVGEVSALKTQYSNGYYFDLKDKTGEGVLSCFIPSFTLKGLGLPLENGMEIAVEGVPRLTRRNGRFLFTVEFFKLVGEGSLKKAYDVLKQKLEEEGLFERKRPLPEFVRRVGIITSRAGAVIHDFRNNIASFGFQLYLKDVRVEGASSSHMIKSAIKYFNEQFPVDVIVIMRGGGSLEDMQSFNDESVVREVYASKITTVVSIGHDKDVPLAQLVADVMVSTPTAAAHAVSATWSRLVEDLPILERKILHNFQMILADKVSLASLQTQRLFGWYGKLESGFEHAQGVIYSQIEKYTHWIEEKIIFLNKNSTVLPMRIENVYNNIIQKLQGYEQYLEQASPERQISLGFSILRDENGKVVKSVKQVKKGSKLESQVSDGTIISEVI